MSKEKKNRMRPLWMPLYVEKFLADSHIPEGPGASRHLKSGLTSDCYAPCGVQTMAHYQTMTLSWRAAEGLGQTIGGGCGLQSNIYSTLTATG